MTAHGASTDRGSVRAPRSAADVGEPTTLVVVRHGRTPNTTAGRFAGRLGEDPGLSPGGRRDAQRLAGVLAGLGTPAAVLPDLPRPSVVVASPMARTRQTARTAAEALGLDPDATVLDEDWVEASFGDWENLTYAEVSQRHPDALAAWQGSLTAAPPNGDALADVMARVSAARRRLVEQHPGRCVLVVTHATCVRSVVHEALDAGDAGMWRTRVTPCALTVVRWWSDGGAEVVTLNATGHLAG